MVAIQVRDVSEQTRDTLAAEAERRGQSLQVYLHEVIEREAASARNLALVERARHRPPMISGAVDVAAIIRAGRQDRATQTLGDLNAGSSAT